MKKDVSLRRFEQLYKSSHDHSEEELVLIPCNDKYHWTRQIPKLVDTKPNTTFKAA